MALSMYQASVPVFTQGLNNLQAILKKGEAGAAGLKLTPEQLLQRALITDMFPLLKQVQRACDTAARGMARLARIEPRPFPDNEASFADLHRRIAGTADYVGSFTATQVDGREDEILDVNLGGHAVRLSSRDFLLRYALPNFFFHCTTTYDILRAAGIAIGKRDFLGSVLQ